MEGPGPDGIGENGGEQIGPVQGAHAQGGHPGLGGGGQGQIGRVGQHQIGGQGPEESRLFRHPFRPMAVKVLVGPGAGGPIHMEGVFHTKAEIRAPGNQVKSQGNTAPQLGFRGGADHGEAQVREPLRQGRQHGPGLGNMAVAVGGDIGHQMGHRSLLEKTGHESAPQLGGQGQPDPMAAARGHRHRLALGVFHAFQHQLPIA